ncbi:hypothetical protein B0T21DRAFT_377092 [Apiosordaria backusii]|uniref:Uncharacterized protein n=1 Tax=Apiosordaria backusii TaxID=314023 RepID=A0AA40DPP2_9PEZI|nr:hypothetical protein B0T21DRAFT_377092 [Apiosordaria backusii]
MLVNVEKGPYPSCESSLLNKSGSREPQTRGWVLARPSRQFAFGPCLLTLTPPCRAKQPPRR